MPDETNTNAQAPIAPQAGGRYKRNDDGSLTTLHQTVDRDTAQYTAEKAARQAAKDAQAAAPAQPADDGGFINDTHKE